MTRLLLRALHFYQEVGEFLFALGLVLAGLRFGQLGDVHAAELWSAHRAEFRFLIKIVGERFVVHGFRGFRIERKFKLLVPVKEETRVTERVVAIASAGAVARDVRGMRRNLVSDDALLAVFGVRQAE